MRIFVEQMLSSNGKYYKTDVATTLQLFRLII